jgi:Tfp pilus assembly protein PilO
MGYYGTQSAGIFSPREAFFVIGASILILSAASVYQFMTLRDTISVLKIHEEELQSARDAAQEMRLVSLEGTRSGATTSLAPRVAALEPQLATLETRVAALEVKRP